MSLDETTPADGDGVNSGVKVSELAGAIRQLKTDLNDGKLEIISKGNSKVIINDDGSVSIYTNGSERVKVDSNGNILLRASDDGTTHGLTIKANKTNARGYHLVVQGATNTNLKGYFGIDTDASPPYLSIEMVEEGVAWGDVHICHDGGYVRMGTGNQGQVLLIGNDAWFRDDNVANTVGVWGNQSNNWGYIKAYVTNPSSQKYKENIRELKENKLDIIKSIKIKKYRLKGTKKDILGIMVEEAPDEIIAQDIHSKTGKPIRDSIDLFSYITLIAKGLKDLIYKVEELEEKLNAIG